LRLVIVFLIVVVLLSGFSGRFGSDVAASLLPDFPREVLTVAAVGASLFCRVSEIGE
jgi:hypothetical protein